MIHQIGIREANQHLSRYIAAVERGEEVIITRRGQPVARLVPVTKKRQLTPEQKEAAAREHRLANGLPPEWPVIVISGKLADV